MLKLIVIASVLIVSTIAQFPGCMLPNDIPELMITGLFVGNLQNSQQQRSFPRLIELYATQDIADLSAYGISATQGAGPVPATNPQFRFPSGSLNAGEFLTIANSNNQLLGWFSIAEFSAMSPVITNNIFFNGDDTILLYRGTDQIIDSYGFIGVDGTDEDWEYLRSYSYRTSGQSCPSPIFNVDDWDLPTIPEVNGARDIYEVEGIFSNDQARNSVSGDLSFPFQTFQLGLPECLCPELFITPPPTMDMSTPSPTTLEDSLLEEPEECAVADNFFGTFGYVLGPFCLHLDGVQVFCTDDPFACNSLEIYTPINFELIESISNFTGLPPAAPPMGV